MNFSISRNSLYKAVQKIINVIPTKTTIDILYNILLSTDDGNLKVTATDLEITQISWCECDVKDKGSIAVPGKLLVDILREMPETKLNFSIDSNLKINIKSDFGEYKLSGQNKNDFPAIPQIESEENVTIKNEYLRRMIEKTIFACSTDNLRPALTGVFCQIQKDHIIMVSTDGHRLVKIMNTNFTSPSIQCDIIIPTRTLNLVARNLQEDGEQNLIIGKNHILFKFSDTLIYSRIITEPYPDYERVIPENNSRELVIDRDTVVASVKRVSLFSNPISYQVKMNLNENNLNIFAQDIDFGGEAHETIACEYTAPELEIAYNANYLLDILRHIDTDKLRIKLETSDGPGLVFPSEQKEHEQLMMLIMPVRLSS